VKKREGRESPVDSVVALAQPEGVEAG